MNHPTCGNEDYKEHKKKSSLEDMNTDDLKSLYNIFKTIYHTNGKGLITQEIPSADTSIAIETLEYRALVWCDVLNETTPGVETELVYKLTPAGQKCFEEIEKYRKDNNFNTFEQIRDYFIISLVQEGKRDKAEYENISRLRQTIDKNNPAIAGLTQKLKSIEKTKRNEGKL